MVRLLRPGGVIAENTRAQTIRRALPYDCRLFKRSFSRLFWSFRRWTLASEAAPTRPTVLIGAPHTSNWDFVLMLAIAWRLGIDVHWLRKKSLFHGWRGPIMRRLGGIAVDRANPADVVGEVVGQVHAGTVFGLVVTPDGT